MPKRSNDAVGGLLDANRALETSQKHSKTQLTLTGKPIKANTDHWVVTSSMLVYNPPLLEPRTKILGLDMDNTLIKTASGKTFAKDANDWKMLNDQVVRKLKEFFDTGYKVVIFSNQRGLTKGYQTVTEFQTKIENIAKKLFVPVQGFFSLVPDHCRKPSTGLWDALERSYNGSVSISRADSFYCGDAAGRPAEGSRKKDHSCADRLFALNLNVPFLTPEQLWYNEPASTKFALPTFRPESLLTEPQVTLPTVCQVKEKPELILMVGYPASGKSYFCRKHMAPLGYTVISRDDLGTWQKCVKACEMALCSGKSVVIDNTNVDVESRERYVKVATSHGCPVRCFVMETEFDHALHNERFRTITEPAHTPIPEMVFRLSRSKYQKPEMKEGFVEIVKQPFLFDRSHPKISIYRQFLLEK